MGNKQSRQNKEIDCLLDLDLSDAIFVDQISPSHVIYKIRLNFAKIFYNDTRRLQNLIYEKQRPIDLNRASLIAAEVDKLTDHFWGQIYIGFVNGDPALLDGQHRIMSTQFCNNEQSYLAYLNLITFKCEEDRFNYFIRLNSNLPVATCYLDTNDCNRDISKRVLQKLKQVYSGLIKDYYHIKPYYLNENYLYEIVADLVAKRWLQPANFTFTNQNDINDYVETLVQVFLNFNISLSNFSTSGWGDSSKFKKYWNNAVKKQFYLGLVDDLRTSFLEYIKTYYSIKEVNNETYEISESDSEMEVGITQIENAINENVPEIKVHDKNTVSPIQSDHNVSTEEKVQLSIDVNTFNKGETIFNNDDNPINTVEDNPIKGGIVEDGPILNDIVEDGPIPNNIVEDNIVNTDYNKLLSTLKRNFPKAIKTSLNPLPPHYTIIYFNHIMTQMIAIALFNNKDPCSEILMFNGLLSTKPANYSNFQRPKTGNGVRYIESAKKCNFYIGLLKLDILFDLFSRYLQSPHI